MNCAVDPDTQRFLDEFLPLCAIPHKSGHEEAISVYLQNWAATRGLSVVRDEANNVIIEKPASPGLENAPRVLMQAHMDMVCVADDGVDFDPLRDPITVINDGKTLKGKGTSLGADDGMGVAYALCVLKDKTLTHGPLRVILTTDEEAGMTGAERLDPVHAQGDYLLNIDEEGYDVICNSSAGGAHMAMQRPVTFAKPSGTVALRVALSNFSGGHSGINIASGRGSAIRELAFLLASAQRAGLAPELAEITGGTADNAIPMAAAATVVLPAAAADAFRAHVAQHQALFKLSNGDVDPAALFEVTPASLPAKVLSAEDFQAGLRFLTVVHNGVSVMSRTTPGHIVCSCSTGIVRLDATHFEVHVLARSSQEGPFKAMLFSIEELAAMTGFTLQPYTPTPGWAENPHSKLVPLVCEAFTEVTGLPMHIKPTHGGLECGWFLRKNPKLDVVALGPKVTNPHCPEETLYLDTVPGVWKTIVRVLEKLAK